MRLWLEPDHVSTYGLTFERGTTFWNRLSHGQLARLGEELERSLFARAIERLSAAGFEHYEVSNFARPGRRCRHNEAYWAGEPYFAAGPGATRYIGGVRETNHRSTLTYLKRVLSGQSPIAEREQLADEDRARELLVFGLRRMGGVEAPGSPPNRPHDRRACRRSAEPPSSAGAAGRHGGLHPANARGPVCQRRDLAALPPLLTNSLRAYAKSPLSPLRERGRG